jgi:predicted enzyme related to lactoylglutathione lyase
MATPSLRGRFVWHELLTTDPAAGIGFYTKVTGWKTQPYADVPGYTLFVAARGPIAGAMALPEEARAMGSPPNWLSYIGTSDVDATARQAVTLGGKILREPGNVSVGRFAILADPQGAVFAIYTPNLLEEQDPKPQVGEFSWHELTTTDPAAAFRFYQELFGWETTRSMDMGPPVGVYQMYGVPGLELGGIYKAPPGHPAPPNWLPYIKVADTRKAVTQATQAGGRIITGPMEVPGGDLIAMGMDPQNACFAVHSVKAAVMAPAPKAAKKAAPKKKAVAKKAVAKKVAAPKKKAAKKAAPKKAAKKAAPKKKAAKKAGRRR